jgi:hypothetical protein
MKFHKNRIITSEFLNGKKTTSDGRNMQHIGETKGVRWSWKDALANMMNLHTFTVGSVNLVMAMVGLPHGELVEVVGEVVRSSRIGVPAGVDGV